MRKEQTTTLEILHLEDDAKDAQLIRDILEEAGIRCHIELVKSRERYEAALAKKKFDLILCDYTVPSFSGTGALLIARGVAPDTPLIFVTETISWRSTCFS